MRSWVAAAVFGLVAGCFGDPAASDCNDGEVGCACGPGATCDGDLQCDVGTCVPPGCSAGALGCPCNDGSCAEGSCVDNVCVTGTATGTSGADGSGAGTSAVTSDTGPSDSTATPSDTGDASTGASDCPLEVHLVFVTAALQKGDFGGRDAADDVCASEAAGLDANGATWKAVLSIDGAPAHEQLEICADVRLVADATGDMPLVATSATWWTTKHTHAIDRRPDGTPTPGTTYVWTGMADASGAIGDHCMGFTTAAALGNAGDPNDANAWAVQDTISPVTCGNPYALYCISQPAG